MRVQEILMNLLGILMMLSVAITISLTASLAISVMYRSRKCETKPVTIETTTPEGTLMWCVPVEKRHVTKN